VYTRR